MPLVTLHALSYKYPGAETWIFRNFGMVLEPGETIRIAGRNGSGKSTLLKLIAGLLKPTEGERVLNQGSVVAYMDQYAGEMLAYNLTIDEQFRASLSPGANAVLSVDLLSQFDLDLHKRPRTFIGHLSGGQRQIVALLCVLASGATVLCLDEFTSALDDHSARIAEKLLEHMTTVTRITIVLVSHSGTGIRVDRELYVST
jgi:ABC-type multidrug transport system ATPase subunit